MLHQELTRPELHAARLPEPTASSGAYNTSAALLLLSEEATERRGPQARSAPDLDPP